MADARQESVWTNHAKECRDAGRKPFGVTENDPFRLIAQRLKKDKCKTILDLGCGPGYWAPVWKGFSYTGFDQNAEMIKLAKEIQPNLNFIQGTDLNIFPDSSFNIVFSAGVLQHNKNNPDKANLVKEIYRLLSPNGYYFFTENTLQTIDPNYTDDYSFTSIGWRKFIEAFGLTFISYASENDKYLFRKI